MSDHGIPLTDERMWESIPEEVREEVRTDFARLRANLPVDELDDDAPAGIGATSSGCLVVKTGGSAYQLMEDGSTMRATPTAQGLELVHFRDGVEVERTLHRRETR